MKLKTPAFWYRDKNDPSPLIENIMRPAACAYRMGFALHQSATSARKAELPIICIGNLNAGGTGKTPTAMALAGIVRRHGLARTPYFLSRGYGGGDIGPLLVDPDKHDAWNTGDEALLLAHEAPTVVCADRLEGAALALRKGADILIMDDGLQNPGIYKDIKLVVINGEMGFGNGRLIPAGPLRAPLKDGLNHADGFILIGEDRRGTLAMLPPEKPVFKAALKTDPAKHPPKDKTYLAFAGLGYPQKFFTYLENELGLSLAKPVTFPDHYPYSAADLYDLHKKAEELGAELLTTQKDFLRLPVVDGIKVHVLPVHLEWEDENALAAFLKSRLS